MEKKKQLIILTGPTAVGKTELSIGLAKAIGGEIISADSMQVYRHMDIGSAKITKEEMQGVPHHLTDILEPFEECNVFFFQKAAKKAMEGIYERGNIPLIVGGTGFYIQSVLYDIAFHENETDLSYRVRLEQLAEKEGAEVLHQKLREVDPVSAGEIHPNNIKRVIRALEYYHLNHLPISLHNEAERQKESPYDFRYFVLTDDRAVLYERIDKRVDKMMEQGLLDEVKKLREMGCDRELVSMQGLGYKELLGYLEGEYDLERAVYLIKRDTRHFAKRQLTWFRRERDVTFINKGEFGYDNEKILAFMTESIKQEGRQ
ncbi:MAG: tRNA (adenosine(37)-N6)-dimethylallyltransferase MiaA [Lachnospiraceae bacterium]|nr:tRNA (adenosine(37)-N6)-dimethylallyltransferase MiaA [Lachnospiraceae bacterium]